ncbi:MAG: ribonuclease P protein component [Candidatus Omnitrophota bacterium]
MKRNAFLKEERLRKYDQIKDIFRTGTPIKGRFLKLYIHKRDDGLPKKRVAFVISKRLCNKNSVLRNRYRRLLREAYRLNKHVLNRPLDIVILAQSLQENTRGPEVQKDLENVFKKFIKKSD